LGGEEGIEGIERPGPCDEAGALGLVLGDGQCPAGRLATLLIVLVVLKTAWDLLSDA